MVDTIVRRGAFGSIDDALAFVRGELHNSGIGGATVQIMAGSSRWPDPGRRYRVAVSRDARDTTEAGR
jgi:hypothetical protein